MNPSILVLGFHYTIWTLIIMKRQGSTHFRPAWNQGLSHRYQCSGAFSHLSFPLSILSASLLGYFSLDGKMAASSCKYQNVYTEYSSVQPSLGQIGPCASWKKKISLDKGQDHRLDMGLSHKQLLKLGWRNSFYIIWTDNGRGRKIRIQKGEWMVNWENKRCH